MQGEPTFVQEILNHNDSQFAKAFAEQLDSEQSSALHIASAKGDLVIVKKLLRVVSPDFSCFLRDCHGRNPLHLAAMKGHVAVLKHLVEEAPSAAREKVDRGVSMLHLCVKHKQLEALRVLVPDYLNEMVNDTDDDGDTVLHLEI